MNICPGCGHRGDEARCPQDGTPMRPEDPQPSAPAAESEGPDAHTADSPAPLAPRKGKADPLIGTIMEGRYEILDRIGAGGMGVVYRARQTTMDRIVAIKVLLRSLASNETSVKRFQLEARAASRLRHPNTITVFDFGQTKDGTLYIAMELLVGEPLDHVIQREQVIDPARAVRIMAQVCRSLDEAHNHGIIHRDLKPDNIFLLNLSNEPDFVKVLDFGVAKLKDPDTSGDRGGTLTQAGMIFGTPKYMSPEQAQSLELDPTSDIYSLGVIMYEMLVGRAPFAGDAPLTILIKHVHEPPPPMEEFMPPGSIPPALEAVVMKALQKDRRQRQQSATTFRIELEEALQTFVPQPSQVLLQVGTGISRVYGPGSLATDATSTVVTSREGSGPTGLGQLGATALQPTPPAGGPRAASGPLVGAGWDFSSEEGQPGLAGRPQPAERKPNKALWAALLGLILLGAGGLIAWVVARTPGAGVVATLDSGLPSAAQVTAVADAGRPAPDAGNAGIVVIVLQTDLGTATSATPPRPAVPRPPGVAGSGGDVRPAAPEQVKLRLTSSPTGASVYLDGATYVGMTPTVISRKRGLVPITLAFRKEGYRDGSHIADLNGDQDIRVTLERLTSAPSTLPAGPAAGGSTTSPTTPPPPPPPSGSSGSQFGKFGELKPLKFGD